MKSLSIRIHGRVQGVGFRYSAQREARKLNLAGFARNEADGSVYCEAQGKEDDLKQFLEWCHKGPWLAKVDRVEKKEASIDESLKDFEVR